MFSTIPNLAGVCPWLLFDGGSPGRLHPVYQVFNRKGLISEERNKKRAWYTMNP
jgi:beta-glucuronidase